MLVSIIILTKNGEKYLDEVLTSVFNQKTDFNYEVIIIDSGSRDKTLGIVKKYPVRLRKIRPEEFGHGKTRNLGVGLAEGEYVVFLTQDATPTDNCWLLNLINPIRRRKEFIAACSRILPRKDANFLRKLNVLREWSVKENDFVSEIEDINLYNSLSFQEKKSLIKFHDISSCIKKNYDINFDDIKFGEDALFAKKVLEKGYKIYFSSKSVIYHSHNYGIKETFERNKIDSWFNKTYFNINRPLYKLFLSFANRIIQDVLSLFKTREIGFFKKVILIFYSPIIHFVEILGQYLGAKSNF